MTSINPVAEIDPIRLIYAQLEGTVGAISTSKGGAICRAFVSLGPLWVNRVGLLRLRARPLKTNDRTSSMALDDVRP